MLPAASPAAVCVKSAAAAAAVSCEVQSRQLLSQLEAGRQAESVLQGYSLHGQGWHLPAEAPCGVSSHMAGPTATWTRTCGTAAQGPPASAMHQPLAVHLHDHQQLQRWPPQPPVHSPATGTTPPVLSTTTAQPLPATAQDSPAPAAPGTRSGCSAARQCRCVRPPAAPAAPPRPCWPRAAAHWPP